MVHSEWSNLEIGGGFWNQMLNINSNRSLGVTLSKTLPF